MGIDAQSTGHTLAQAEALEVAARKLLGLPRFPDGATGPRARALLEQINADRMKLGDTAALRKYARYCTTAHVHVVTSDPQEIKSTPSARPLVAETDGSYAYPDSTTLRAALSDADKRKRCSAAELAKLDAHAAAAKPIAEKPAEETPKELARG